MSENSLTSAALYYASRGWRVFPITPRQKAPPLLNDWQHLASADAAKVKEWWRQFPEANIGIACGKESNLVVLDIDTDKGGAESFMAMQVEHDRIPDSIEALTGGGGRHILFAHPGPRIPNSASKLGPGLDIRGDGGYIVAPPSVHPSGNRYEWEPSCKPSQTVLADMPEWMVKDLAEKPLNITVVDGNGRKLAPPVGEKINGGTRNATLTSLGGSMRRRGMDTDAIYAALWAENQNKCDPPLSADEVMNIAKSVGRYEPTSPPNFQNSVGYNGNGNKAKVEPREPHNAYEVADAFMDLLDHLDGRSVPTHILPIDKSVGGLERQTLTILGARPSMGKSTLAWQIARNVAANKLKAYFFSLEMSETSLWAKAACGVCGIRWRDVRNGDITDTQRSALIKAATDLTNSYGERLLIDDRVNTSETIWACVEKHKPDLVVVDHLRLVADQNDSEVQRLGAITGRLKTMSKEFNCAVLCLAQLNREVEHGADKRPQLKDLRDSGQIEENGDLILMLYREDYYEPPKGLQPLSNTEVLVRKFRDDILNQKIDLSFDTTHQWFGEKNVYTVR
jgi:KaiC/GvpD/RAD55 family RecA-like ATPase